MAVTAAVKLNGEEKVASKPIPRNSVKLAASIANNWFVVVDAAQFRDRMNGDIWAAKTSEFRVYDEIKVVVDDESEMTRLLVAEVEPGFCALVELPGYPVKLPAKRPIAGPRIPPGYEPLRDLHGYRIKRLSDGLFMGPPRPRLEEAVRDLLDHATLRGARPQR